MIRNKYYITFKIFVVSIEILPQNLPKEILYLIENNPLFLGKTTSGK